MIWEWYQFAYWLQLVTIITHIIFRSTWDEMWCDIINLSKWQYFSFVMSLILCKFGLSALQVAAFGGRTEFMKLLIHGGADVNSKESLVSDMIWEIVMTAFVSYVIIELSLWSRVSVTTSIGVIVIILIYKLVHSHVFCIFENMEWDDISSFDSTDNIYHLIIYSVRYQNGRKAFFVAANVGHNDIMKLLLDKGADVNSRDKVSNMIWLIVVVNVCVSDCVMRQFHSFVTTSTSIVVTVIWMTHKYVWLQILYFYIFGRMSWVELIWDFSKLHTYLLLDNVFGTISGWCHSATCSS